jgi:hypothetical protein
MSTLHDARSTLVIISRAILVWMKNASDKVVEKIKTRFIFSIFFFENRSVFEIMWKKYCTAGQATDDTVIQCMLFACRISKATDTRSENAIYCPYNATMVARTLLNVTLYVHCLFCLTQVARGAVWPPPVTYHRQNRLELIPCQVTAYLGVFPVTGRRNILW